MKLDPDDEAFDNDRCQYRRFPATGYDISSTPVGPVFGLVVDRFENGDLYVQVGVSPAALVDWMHNAPRALGWLNRKE